MNRNIVYFINPISGTRGKDKLLQLIDEKTRFHKIAYQIIPTNAAGNYNFLKEIANSLPNEMPPHNTNPLQARVTELEQQNHDLTMQVKTLEKALELVGRK